MAGDSADLVVVGAGAIGGWASWFAKRSGAAKVVVIDKGRAGQGASSRAAGMVRAQGGNPITVELGRWSIDFYESQSEVLGIDSGFRRLGYLLVATSEAEVAQGRLRVEMQRECGLDARWISAAEACELDSTLTPESILGASYHDRDGCVDPPRNVLAYTAAMRDARVELREGAAFTGLRTEPAPDGLRVTAVETSQGPISTDRVLLTGGPELASVGAAANVRIPAWAVRHQVAVTEPRPEFGVPRAMGFDLGAGLYWRLEDGGLLFGMSNPDEPPGPAASVDWPYLELMKARLGEFCPIVRELDLRRVWAATIEYTPDHHPILGPAFDAGGGRLWGATVACAGGHGMMWGPAAARIAADLALEGRTDLVDVSDLGLDRFDEQGRSRLAPDPIALPFPTT